MARLVETTFSESLQVDRENKVIRGVRVIGRESKNGRTYSDNSLRQLAEMYEGIDVNIDHPSRDNPDVERSLADGFGILKNNTLGSDGVYADLHYLESHVQAPAILERAERFSGSFGLSHNAEGQLVQEGDEWVVESIDVVHSVDLVNKPATNKGLFESKEERKMVKKTLREWLHKATPKHATKFIEMLGDAELADVAAEVEMPEDGSNPAEAVKDALAQEAMDIFKDDAVDPKETGKKVAELAKVVADVAAKVAPAAAEDEGSEEEEEEKAAEVAESRKMLARLNRVEAKNMLLESDRDATPERVAAVAAIPEANRQKLVESWPAKGSQSDGERPSYSRPAHEPSGSYDDVRESIFGKAVS